MHIFFRAKDGEILSNVPSEYHSINTSYTVEEDYIRFSNLTNSKDDWIFNSKDTPLNGEWFETNIKARIITNDTDSFTSEYWTRNKPELLWDDFSAMRFYILKTKNDDFFTLYLYRGKDTIIDQYKIYKNETYYFDIKEKYDFINKKINFYLKINDNEYFYIIDPTMILLHKNDPNYTYVAGWIIGTPRADNNNTQY